MTDPSSTTPPRTIADIRPSTEEFIYNPGGAARPGWSDDLEIDKLFQDLPGTAILKTTGAEVPLYLTQEAYDPAQGRRALGNLTIVARHKAEKECARYYPYVDLTDEGEQLRRRVAEEYCERWWNHLEETSTNRDYDGVKQQYIDQYEIWFRASVVRFDSEFPSEAARRMGKPEPPVIGPTHYPRPTNWDNAPPSREYGHERVDTNLDPREHFDLADYVTQWLFSLGHNRRILGIDETDWDLAREWWAGVEELREAEADSDKSNDDFTLFCNDAKRLQRAAHLYVCWADDSSEASRKLSWRYLADLDERLTQLQPERTPRPPAVEWHLSGTVKITDIHEVPGGHLYELELVDERRLSGPIRFEIEVPNDGEPELREPAG